MMELKRACPECRGAYSWAMILVCVLLTCALLVLSLQTVVYAESASGGATRTVSLDKEFLDAEEAFGRACGKCHPAPDPAQPTCIAGLKQDDLLAIWDYMHKMREGAASSLDCPEPEGKPIFESTCDKCHALPDPSKPSCTSETPKEDLSLAHTFMESARAGKALYESRCTGCHELIEPASKTFEYWSKHICDGEGKLDNEGKQRILLYLKTHAKN
jgi:cytochrome c5